MRGPTITFAGGAGGVTGSKYLVDAGARVLLDCGLFQGLKELRLRNWAAPPFNPQSLDAVLLSHAHLDHSGALPLIVKQGFRGRIYCSAATRQLAELLLMDSAWLQEEDAARANRYGYSKHHPALPLYDREDVGRTMELFRTAAFDRDFDVARNMTARFRRTGHILGAASVDLRIRDSHLVFSGDLGRWNRPILHDPELVPEADVLLVESTYGDRRHAKDPEKQLEHVITETAHRGGTVVIPSFAVGRAQELIWTIRKLEDEGRLPLIAVYLDSPMAIEATEIYTRHTAEHDVEMKLLASPKLSTQLFHLVRTPEESKALNGRSGPLVIIAGSGMATGGRVLHHLEHRLGDHRSTVLLIGYQAAGTRGRALQDGAKEVKIHGKMVPVRARVEMIDGLSAHGDQDDLVRWMRGFERAPKQTWVVHGEPEASAALAKRIESELGWKAGVAQDGAAAALPLS